MFLVPLVVPSVCAYDVRCRSFFDAFWRKYGMLLADWGATTWGEGGRAHARREDVCCLLPARGSLPKVLVRGLLLLL